MPNLVVLVIDRLQAAYLGAYGNSWVPTPRLDALAVRSLVFDQAFLLTPRLAEQYPAVWWQGRHPLFNATDRPSVIQRLGQQGVVTALVTDEPLAERAGQEHFDQVVTLPPASGQTVAADLEDTAWAAWFAVATETVLGLADDHRHWLAWLHGGTLGRVWDAPEPFRWQVMDAPEDDPTAVAVLGLCEPPALELPPEFDPDVRWQFQQAYAAQVSLWDTCLGIFLDALASLPEPPAVLITAARGFPLGEHRVVGAIAEPLLEELTHLPLILHLPGDSSSWGRCSALVNAADVAGSLASLMGRDLADPPPGTVPLLGLLDDPTATAHEAVLMASGDERALRTAAWLLRQPAADDRTADELFLKPDDRWDISDVASRCAEERERLAQYLAAWQAAGTPTPPSWPEPLPAAPPR